MILQLNVFLKFHIIKYETDLKAVISRFNDANGASVFTLIVSLLTVTSDENQQCLSVLAFRLQYNCNCNKTRRDFFKTAREAQLPL